jgi:hypothetical protein
MFEIPGKVKIREVGGAKPHVWPNGEVTHGACSLGELRALVEAARGLLRHPRTGEALAVSLDEWTDSDPATTYLAVDYISREPPKV